MNPTPLSAEERAIISTESETLLEIVKGMSVENLRTFDLFKPKYTKHYNDVQIGWLEKEAYLVGAREGHKPTEIEVMDDVFEHHNELRFRAYYSMRYPEMVCHVDRLE